MELERKRKEIEQREREKRQKKEANDAHNNVAHNNSVNNSPQVHIEGGSNHVDHVEEKKEEVGLL